MVSFKEINSFKNDTLFMDRAVISDVVFPTNVVEDEDSEKKNPIHRKRVKVVGTTIGNIFISKLQLDFLLQSVTRKEYKVYGWLGSESLNIRFK